MRKTMLMLGAMSLATLIAGCAHFSGGGNKAYGRQGPDEYAVARQAPLVIPPEFSLKPPQPGAARPQDANPSSEALQAMFGGPAPTSAGQAATLDQAGAAQADPGVRSSAGDPGTNVVDKGTTTRDIVAAPQGDGQAAQAQAR